MPSDSIQKHRHPVINGPDHSHLLAAGDGTGLWAWRSDNGDLILQNLECDITVPATALRDLAEAALAIHVHNGRRGGRPGLCGGPRLRSPGGPRAGLVGHPVTTARRADRRSTSNSNTRGSSATRRRRRQWLVDEFGDGEFVACFQQISRHCEYVCDVDTVSPDRLVLGADGGSYRRGNIQPSCRPCQREQGGRVGAARRWS